MSPDLLRRRCYKIGVMTQRHLKVAQTRIRIQSCALSLFRQKGLSGTTVNEIAAAADVSPRTFFRYFATKEETLFSTDLLAEIVASYKCAPSTLGSLEALILALSHFGEQRLTPEDEERRSLRRELQTETSVKKFQAQLIDNVSEKIVEVTAERLGTDTDKDLRPHALASIFRAVLEQHFTTSPENRPEFTDWRNAFSAVLGD